MSSRASKSSDLLAGWSAGCDRLVHPSVSDAEERGRQRRLIGTTLALPFLYAAAAAQALAPHFDVATVLAGLCLILVAGWLAPVLLAATGRRAPAQMLAIAAGIAVSGVVLAAAGGPASPLALLLVPLIAEPYWMRRSRTAAAVGLTAAGAAVAVQMAMTHLLFVGSGETTASAWFWLTPAVYAASLWLRFGDHMGDATPAGELTTDRLPPDAFGGAVVLRIHGGGEIGEISERADDILGLPAELLMGDGFFERIHVADRVAYLSALADLREGAASRRLEIRLRLPAGASGEPAAGYRPFAAELARATEGSGIVAVLRDNAELAELRAELAAARDSLESGELAKSRFLAAVSHELRTPLNAIIGFSDMLVHEMFGGFTDPRQREYAGLIRESGSHLLAVVNSILDVSKIESGAYTIHPEPFVFEEAVEMCRSMMAHQAESKGVALATQIDPNAGEIHGDRRAIQQILINLVSNAVKFTPEGGQVAVGGKRLGSRLHFWVSDTGIGIAEEDLARLGQPFMQVQNDYTRRYDGTGLGLSLVKGLVALHEGTMSIESTPGDGTTVTISLPCDGPSKAQPKPRGELVPITRERMMEGQHGALRKTA